MGMIIGHVVGMVCGSMGDERVRSVSDKVFDRFDRDHSGTLDKAELQAALGTVCSFLGKLCPDFILDTALGFFDADGDGSCDRDEFFAVVLRMVRKMREQG
eukprot:TRINITY_DN12020_c0_g1_i1.p2 TRINITY_DN12020_c0_g1~~TRINITY_DN12020_c0_g1_i1.p2  ORF type:complete len:101 (-),score=7.26 TRINITY_DN12020_c0_g1_i1:94-396(-)